MSSAAPSRFAFPPATAPRARRLALAIACLGVNVSAQLPEKEPPRPDPAPPAAGGAARPAQLRLEWNRRTLAGAYAAVGRKDPRWDDAARRCLEDAAVLQSDRNRDTVVLQRRIGAASHQAVLAGCDDPLVAYFHARYFRESGGTASRLAAQYRTCADQLQLSDYPAVRKFYASLAAAEQSKAAAGKGAAIAPETHDFRQVSRLHLLAMLEEDSLPVAEAADACLALLTAVNANPRQHEESYRALEKPLFRRWPLEAGPHLVKGSFHIKHAWAARGSGTVETVTEQGWKLFAERLKIARQALERAWALDPTDLRICSNMITVELGSGERREDMERWFERGMSLDPNNYGLCHSKLYYLEPKWHGSPEAMVAFGRECVQSTRWGGRVPLILVAAYENLSRYVEKKDLTLYWTSPEIWADIQAAYEKYFRLNPSGLTERNHYAKYAYRCGQWDVFLQQVDRLGSALSPVLLGGRTELENMLRTARAQTGRAEGKPRR